MPWVSRASDNRRRRLRRNVRRWRYDHAEHMVSIGIGAAVVGATTFLILVWRLLS